MNFIVFRTLCVEKIIFKIELSSTCNSSSKGILDVERSYILHFFYIIQKQYSRILRLFNKDC